MDDRPADDALPALRVGRQTPGEPAPAERAPAGRRRRRTPETGWERTARSGARSWLPPGRRLRLGRDLIVALIAATALLLGAGLFAPFAEDSPATDLALALAWLGIDLVALGWLWRHRQKLREIATTPPVALLLVVNLGVVASIAWSFDPLASARAAALISATTAVGLMIGLALRPARLLDLLIWSYAVFVVTAAIATLAAPGLVYVEYPIYPEGSYFGWVGLQGNKNLAGSTAATACLVFAVGLLRGRIRPWLGAVLLLGAIAALIATWSVTALISGGIGLAMLLIFFLAHRAGLPSLVIFLTGLITLGVATYLGVLFADEVTATFGKAPTLTGRTTVWAEAVDMIRRAPWTGYGAGVVYGLGEASWFQESPSTITLEHAHNGLLDLASQVGLPLAALALAQLPLTAWAAVVALARQKSSLTYFALAYVFLFVGHNIAESGLYRANYEEWILYVAIVACLSSLGRNRAAPGRPPAHRGARRSGRRSRSSIPAEADPQASAQLR